MEYKEKNRIRTIQLKFTDEERKNLEQSLDVYEDFENFLWDIKAKKVKLHDITFSRNDILTTRWVTQNLCEQLAHKSTIEIDVEVRDDDEEEDEE